MLERGRNEGWKVGRTFSWHLGTGPTCELIGSRLRLGQLFGSSVVASSRQVRSAMLLGGSIGRNLRSKAAGPAIGVVWVVHNVLTFQPCGGTPIGGWAQRPPCAWWTCDVPNHSLGKGRMCPTQSCSHPSRWEGWPSTLETHGPQAIADKNCWCEVGQACPVLAVSGLPKNREVQAISGPNNPRLIPVKYSLVHHGISW